MVCYLCINPTVTIEPEGLFRMSKEKYNRVRSPEQEWLGCELDLTVNVQFSITLKAIRFTANTRGIPLHVTWQESQPAPLC